MSTRRKCGLHKRPSRYVLALIAILLLFLFILFIQTSYYNTSKSEYYRTIHGYIGNEENVIHWIDNKYTGCGGNFTGYGHMFAVLKNVTLTKDHLKFYVPCNRKEFLGLDYSFRYGKEGTHLNDWMKNVIPAEPRSYFGDGSMQQARTGDSPIDYARLSNRCKLVVIVQRYEFANTYHTMTDWYNVFLVATLLRESTDDVQVLLVGNNIHGPLDAIWGSMFGKIFYTGEITQPIIIPKLAWNILGYESPINYLSRSTLPFVKEFNQFVLRRHGVTDTLPLNCDKLRIVFLLRRDYVTHAGNKKGTVSRKIKNEDELLEALRQDYPTADVQGLQFDRFSFKEQLQFVANTDIFIGMHGAGLVHALFLPSHAAVLELYPLYRIQSLGIMYFRAMARWKKLKYTSWQNMNPNNEFPNDYTYIPPNVLQTNVRKLYKQICP